MLRITHAVGTPYFSGLERYAVEVATTQAARGHDVEVIGGKPSVMQSLLRGTGVRWSPGGNTAELMRSLLRAGRRDVVHSHITKADYCASATAPATRATLISTRHITAPRGWTRAAKLVAPVVRRRLALEIAVSSWTSAHFVRPADVVLLNGVRPAVPHGPVSARVVLMAHRLAPEKDTTTGLRAWVESGLADAGWSLQVAGVGEEREALERRVKDLGVEDSVTFLGWVDDVDAIFRRASILLAPAPTEPCGLSILEAMAMGLPVVASASGGNLETVGSLPSAAVFPPGDARAAAALLVRLAGDDDARGSYGRALLELHRERFTLDGHVDRLMALYGQVTRSARRGTAAGVLQPAS
jgi:glycosyltransferase involved in cell wall biosynthesis